MTETATEASATGSATRVQGGQRAVLVHVLAPGAPSGATSGATTGGDPQTEFRALARAAGAEIAAELLSQRARPDPRFLLGSGKVEELTAAVATAAAEVVLIDHVLSPAQERNLERAVGRRVLDRSGLILDIFAQRARSHEGKLQVEMAQLQRLSTRLVRGWTHLERQRGGIGLRGPGETQLETDRRLIGRRLHTLRARLATVALVGYTNAGKTTLFNALTGAGQWAADQVFATLDPTLRRVALPQGGALLLADTVGFIRDLPHELIAAFRATLTEASEARALLHVIDAASPERAEQMQAVQDVLRELGADDVPCIEVYNQIDRLGLPPRIERDAEGHVRQVWVSAHSGAGLDALRQALAELDGCGETSRWLLPPTAARARAALYASGGVRSERIDPAGESLFELILTQAQLDALCRSADLRAEWRLPAASPP